MNDDFATLATAALHACIDAMTPANNDEEGTAIGQAREALTTSGEIFAGLATGALTVCIDAMTPANNGEERDAVSQAEAALAILRTPA